MSISACRRPVYLCVRRRVAVKRISKRFSISISRHQGDCRRRPGAEAAASRGYPDAVFSARCRRGAGAVYAAARRVRVSSRTDTFGLVLLEALASGLPVAAFPVMGPRDVIGDAPWRS